MGKILKRYTKQLLAVFFLIVATVMTTSYIMQEQLNGVLIDIHFKKLSAVKTVLKENIKQYFDDKSKSIHTLAESRDVKSALIDFEHAYGRIEDEYDGTIEADRLLRLIDKHKQRVHNQIPNASAPRLSEEYFPKNKSGLILQNLYVLDNPFESKSRWLFHASNAKLSYDTVHKKYHDTFVDFLKRYGLYDIFLIDKEGNIVYSVYKELDFGTNLKNGVYAKSPLADAYRAALQKGTLFFSDYKPYEPSYNQPAAFFVQPIFVDGEVKGAIAFQIAIDGLDSIMTFNQQWETMGLGDTGEAYLVGQDVLMRSNSRFRFSIDNPLVKELGTSVGVLNVKSKAVEDALDQKSGQAIIADYRGEEVLSSYTYVDVFGHIWGLVVEVDKKEVDENIALTIRTFLVYGILMAMLAIILIGYILVRLIVRPIEKLEEKLDSTVNQKAKEIQKITAILNEYKYALDEAAIVSKTDTRGIIKDVNDAFCKISGYSRDELIGQPHNIVRHPDNLKSVFEELWRTIKNRQPWHGVLKNRKKNGGDYVVKSTIVPILDDQNNIVEYISIRTDISELISKEKQLIEQATDELTKLPNRIKLLEDLSEGDDERKLAIIQIEKFKEINDFYGFDKGDMLLLSISSTMQGIVLDIGATLYVIGQGEFALMVRHGVPMEPFVKTLENMSTYFDHNIIVIGSDSFNISVSIGIAKGNGTKLFYNAEMALRKAFEGSKTLVSFENEDDFGKEYENNIRMTKKIKEAIKNDDILVFAQIIKPNFEGAKPKYECLIRMFDKENKKVLSPFFFLDIAKKARLYPTLTKIVIEKSFDYFKDTKDEFSINLSIEDVLSHDIVTYLKKKLDYYKIGHRVVIELVESEGIENFDEVHAFIREFKGYGCKIAIDDFGTGYSNFEYLMKLDADYIKIDGSLIKNIDTDKNARIVVELILDFAKRMDVYTIAEFVHSDSVYQTVKSMGVDYVQGYYLGEPQELNTIG